MNLIFSLIILMAASMSLAASRVLSSSPETQDHNRIDYTRQPSGEAVIRIRLQDGNQITVTFKSLEERNLWVSKHDLTSITITDNDPNMIGISSSFPISYDKVSADFSTPTDQQRLARKVRDSVNSRVFSKADQFERRARIKTKMMDGNVSDGVIPVPAERPSTR